MWKVKKKACNKIRVIHEESKTKNKLVEHKENQQREEAERETLHKTQTQMLTARLHVYVNQSV